MGEGRAGGEVASTVEAAGTGALLVGGAIMAFVASPLFPPAMFASAGSLVTALINKALSPPKK